MEGGGGGRWPAFLADEDRRILPATFQFGAGREFYSTWLAIVLVLVPFLEMNGGETHDTRNETRRGGSNNIETDDKGTWVFRMRMSAVRQAFSFPSCSSSVSMAKDGQAAFDKASSSPLARSLGLATHFSIVAEHRWLAF